MDPTSDTHGDLAATSPSFPRNPRLRSQSPPLADNAATSPSSTKDRTKDRAVRACSSCSRQKLKCDGDKPCSRCVVQNITSECSYLPSMRGKMRGKRQQQEWSTSSDAQRKRGRVVSREEAVHHRKRGRSDVVEHAGQPTRGATGDHGLFRSTLSDMGPPSNSSNDHLHWKRNNRLSEDRPPTKGLSTGRGDNEHTAHSLTELSPLDTPLSISSTANNVAFPDRQLSPSQSHIDFVSGGASQLFRPQRELLSRLSDSRRSQSPIRVDDQLTTLPLPGDRNPLAVLAEASACASGRSPSGVTSPDRRLHGEDQGLGEGDVYYAPLARTLKDEAPHIMAHISVHEAENLFDLYFTYLHPHLPLLDAAHSSPSAVARRNNFLFNAICCASARAFNIVMWARLAEFAKYEMERLPKEKNIDVIQGHLIYATWNLHRPKNFELDMTWLRTGLAVRTAIDINLHRVALVKQAREGLPTWVVRAIARTWLGTYIADRTMSAQLGKPSTMRGEKSITLYIELLRDARLCEISPSAARSSNDPGPSSDDLWIAALAEWSQILSRSVDTFRAEAVADDFDRLQNPGGSSLANGTAFPDLVRVFDRQFMTWREQTEKAMRASGLSDTTDSIGLGSLGRTSIGAGDMRYFNGEESSGGRHSTRQKTRSNSAGILGLPFMLANTRLHEQYARLVVHSLGLERAVDSSPVDSSPVDLPATFVQYLSAATRIIQTFQTSFDANNVLRLGASDALFTFLTYAAVSILRVLQSKFAHLEPDRDNILHLAGRAADMLARAAMTADHLPAAQSIFLSRLIDVHTRQPGARSQGRTKGPSSVSGDGPSNRTLFPIIGRNKSPHNDQSMSSHGVSRETSVPSIVQPDDSASAQRLPKALNFEAFGQMLDQDQGRSVWPPMLSPAWSPFRPTQDQPAGTNQIVATSDTYGGSSGMDWMSDDLSHNDTNNMPAVTDHSSSISLQYTPSNHPFDPFSTSATAAEPRPYPLPRAGVPIADPLTDATSGTIDQRNWITGMSDYDVTSVPVPGAALGLGMSLYGIGEDDLVFTQDSFWRSLIDSEPAPALV